PGRAVLAARPARPPILGQPRPLTRASRLGPLHEREFRLLFAGRTISMLGSAIAPVGLAFAVLDLTGSTSDLGIVLASRAIATIVLLLIGGVWADRVPRRVVRVPASVAGG